MLLAAGREAEVFLEDDGTVLKLMRRRDAEERIRREAASLRAVAGTGLEVPEVVDVVVVDDRPGLRMQHVSEANLLERLGRRPWTVLEAGRSIGAAHARMHDIVAPAELPDLWEELRERIELRVEDERLRAATLRVLESLPRADRLCHGDLHFGNMLGSWSAPVIIDWGGATRGDPVADVARTRLLLGIGEPGPDAPTLVRLLAPVFRGAVVNSYVATYRKARPFDPQLLERWELVQTAARIGEVPSERGVLMGLLEKGLSRQESTGVGPS